MGILWPPKPAASRRKDLHLSFSADHPLSFAGCGGALIPPQTGTFRLCFTRFSVKLVLIDCTFGSSTMAFFTVAS